MFKFFHKAQLSTPFFFQCSVCVSSFLSLTAQNGSGLYSTSVHEILKMCYIRVWPLCILSCFSFTWPLLKGVLIYLSSLCVISPLTTANLLILVDSSMLRSINLSCLFLRVAQLCWEGFVPGRLPALKPATEKCLLSSVFPLRISWIKKEVCHIPEEKYYLCHEGS